MVNERDHSEERAHSELGGSRAYIWTNCPGSVALARTVPPEPASAAALGGTEAHSIAEIVLEDWLRHRLEGTDPDIRSELTAQNEDYLEAARDYKEAIWKHLLEESITGKAYGIEDEFTFSKEFDSYGFLDFWAVYTDDRGKRVGVIADFKYGYVHVEALENDQLLFYACALREYLLENGKDLDRVRCAIFQPNDGTGEPYREVTYTVKQLERWKQRALKAAREIYIKKSTKLKPGDWCKNCKAKGVCSAYEKQLQEKAQVNFLVPSEDLPVPKRLDDEVLRRIVIHYNELLDFLKACKKYALGKALQGSFPGLKLVAGASKRRLKESPALESFLKGQGLKPDQYQKRVLRSLGDIEKLLKTTGLSKAEMTDLLKPLCDRTTPPLLLVPENDPRPALEGAGSLLTAIEDEGEE